MAAGRSMAMCAMYMAGRAGAGAGAALLGAALDRRCVEAFVVLGLFACGECTVVRIQTSLAALLPLYVKCPIRLLIPPGICVRGFTMFGK